MTSVRAADTWRDGAARPERHPGSARPDLTGPERPVRMARPPVPPPMPRGRASGAGPGAGYSRPAVPDGARPSQRVPRPVTDRDDDTSGGRGGSRAASRPVERPSARVAPPETGSRLRGIVAVLGVFVITLAGGAVDSFFGVGLGTLTLVTLVAASAVGTLLVRRRDLLSLVVAPPLVFVAVAAVNVGLAPSATLNLPTIATVLVRGFPTMAVATGVALVVAVVRWAARR